MKFFKCFLVLLLISSLNCSGRYVYMPKLNIAGPEIEGDKFKVSDYQLVDKDVEGKDYFHIIIFFPIMKDNQELYQGIIANAVNNVCKEKNLSFMTNVRIYFTGWYIPYIYGRFTITVNGEGWSSGKKTAFINELNNHGMYAVSSDIKEINAEK